MIGLIKFPYSDRNAKPTSQLIESLKPSVSAIYLITGGDKEVKTNITGENSTHHHFQFPIGRKIISRIFYFLIFQIQVAILMIKERSRISGFIFFIGGEGLLLPLLIGKILDIKIVILLAGFPSKGSKIENDTLSIFHNTLARFAFFFSNRILVYSKRIILERNLTNYQNKTIVVRRHYIDTSRYLNSPKITQRKEIIGFLGRLVYSKGIFQLIQAFELISKERSDIVLLIGGDGEERFVNQLKLYISQKCLSNRIIFQGWVDKQDIPDFLEKIKYFVLPSFSEGLPNVLLEAMASGACVFSTTVGAVNDIIKNGKNGFILENNSPQEIYNKLTIAMKDPKIELIAMNGNKFVQKNFTYQNAVRSFKGIARYLYRS